MGLILVFDQVIVETIRFFLIKQCLTILTNEAETYCIKP